MVKLKGFCRGYCGGFLFSCGISSARALDTSTLWGQETAWQGRPLTLGEGTPRVIMGVDVQYCVPKLLQTSYTQQKILWCHSLTSRVHDTHREIPDHKWQLRKVWAMLGPQKRVHVWDWKPRQKPMSWEGICPVGKAIALFCLMGMLLLSNCLLNSYVYAHRLALLSALVYKASFCRDQKLLERLIITPSIEERWPLNAQP